MTSSKQMSEFQRYYERRRRQDRHRRMLNNLPLAHRMASDRAADAVHGECLLGQAMVGLVEAADRFDPVQAGGRFGAFAKPHITSALDRPWDEDEVEIAKAEIAEAISSQDRVQELASFLEVPVDALVGGLMDATARERVFTRRRSLRGVA